MASLNVIHLTARLGRFQLGPLDLEVSDGETLILIGPSGSGKTTLLETLAGFRHPQSGMIRLDGKDITRLPPERRRLALVVQDYALFPHLSVVDNVGFGQRYHRLPPGRIEQALATLGIAELALRRPQGLSGGERQRVALARALVTEPAAFLLDEPLAALDAVTRRQVRAQLGQLLRQLRATCLLVTHDYDDAFALADRVALLAGGTIRQIGAPAEVYRRPANAWVASFLGMESLRPDRVDGKGNHTVYLVAGVPLRAADSASIGTQGTELVYRPEDVRLCEEAIARPNVLPGTIRTVRPEGALTRIAVELTDGAQVVALLSRRELQQIGVEVGRCVGCAIAPDDLWPVGQDSSDRG